MNSKDSMGNTCLHLAVANQNLRIVKALEEFGANATVRNDDDVCAIDTAITEDFKEIKMWFLSQSKYKMFDFSGMNEEVEEVNRSARYGAFTTENTNEFRKYSK